MNGEKKKKGDWGQSRNSAHRSLICLAFIMGFGLGPGGKGCWWTLRAWGQARHALNRLQVRAQLGVLFADFLYRCVDGGHAGCPSVESGGGAWCGDGSTCGQYAAKT